MVIGMSLLLCVPKHVFVQDVFSSLITTKHSFAKKDGILWHKDLPFIWAQYPVEQYPVLLALLRQFEIIQPLPENQVEQEASANSTTIISRERSLVPCLLPRDVRYSRFMPFCTKFLSETKINFCLATSEQYSFSILQTISIQFCTLWFDQSAIGAVFALGVEQES